MQDLVQKSIKVSNINLRLNEGMILKAYQPI